MTEQDCNSFGALLSNDADSRTKLTPPGATPDVVSGTVTDGVKKVDIPGSAEAPSLDKVDNFRVEGLVGRGGFGAVYKAMDTHLNRPVALKFLSNVLDSRCFKLFEREAHSIAALGKHPGIVQIYSWAEYCGQAYMALEYVPSSAAALLAKSPSGLSEELALRIAAEAAEALHYAHGQGIVHRDVKPENILYDAETDKVKVADFGLACLYEARDRSILEGEASGSPPYMSPEHITGENIGPKSDIFSLGVTLYKMLSGKYPFEGKSQHEITHSIMYDQKTPLRKRRPALPEEVFCLVDKAIAHKPEDRFSSAEEMANALRHVLKEYKGISSTVTMTGRRRAQFGQVLLRLPRRVLWMVSGSVIALALGVGGTLALDYVSTSATKTVLAEANSIFDASGPVAAEEPYRRILAKYPKEDWAQYGLGFALTQQGKFDEAGKAFSAVQDPKLRAEGEAALAFQSQGVGARKALEAARRVSSSTYLDTLLASVDVSEHNYAAAVERLKTASRDTCRFDWQWDEQLRVLGQAYYHLADYVNAQRVFGQLAQEGRAEYRDVAQSYLDMAKRQVEAQTAQLVQQRAAEIREMIDKGQVKVAEQLPWTSRPLTFMLLPVQAGKGRIALDTGLADVLPDWLGPALESSAPMKWVDREHLAELLQEQQLSGQLSSGSGQLALAQLVGARLIIECRVTRWDDKEYLNAVVVDTETSTRISPEPVELQLPLERGSLVKQLVASIWDAVQKKYPVRGQVRAENGRAFIDTGSNVGVAPGMRFAVTSIPDGPALPNKSTVVEGAVGPDTAEVRCEGFGVENLPPEGWYAIQQLN